LTTGADPITHAIRCNEDGTDTERHDVFDLAELCYRLSEEGMEGKDIAVKLGWVAPAMVTFHKQIKERLHSRAWSLAADDFTKTENLVNQDKENLVNQDFTKVNWRETHLREIVSTIPAQDNATYRAQLTVIRSALDRFADSSAKVTAKWIAQQAAREAWHIELGRYMRDHLVSEVPFSERKTLLKHIRANAFGKSHSDSNLERFANAITSLNEQALGVQLYHDDALLRVPLLQDSSISLVVTDPPYNTTDYDWDQIGTPAEYLNWTRQWLETVRPKLMNNYHLYIFCAPEYQADIEILLRQNDWPIKSRIIWEYRNLVKGRDATDKYIVNYQVVFHCGTHALNFPPEWDHTRFSVQTVATPQSNFKEGKEHPTQKPLELIKRFVQFGSKPGETVLDLFAGGGTTGQACHEVGQRLCIMIEQNDEYCSKIEQRLNIKRK